MVVVSFFRSMTTALVRGAVQSKDMSQRDNSELQAAAQKSSQSPLLGVGIRRRVGIIFRRAREDLGVSQERSADLAGIHPPTCWRRTRRAAINAFHIQRHLLSRGAMRVV